MRVAFIKLTFTWLQTGLSDLVSAHALTGTADFHLAPVWNKIYSLSQQFSHLLVELTARLLIFLLLYPGYPIIRHVCFYKRPTCPSIRFFLALPERGYKKKMAAPIDRYKQVLLTRVLALLAVVPCFNPSVDVMDNHMHRPDLYHPALLTSTDNSQPVNSVFVYLNGMVCNRRCKCAMALAIVKDRSDHKRSLLLSSGIEPNPGPRRPKFPCLICKKACKGGQP